MSATTVTVERTGIGARLWSLLSSRETGIFIAFALVVLATTMKNPTFLFSADGWRDLLLTPAIVAVVAIGQAVVIITRSVDLSVGSIVGLSAYLVGTLFMAMPGFPVALMFFVGIAFGAFLGLINGALVAFGKVPAMVITLGTLYAYRGINVAWTGSNRINASDMPDDFLALGTQQILTIPVLTIIALVILGVVGWYMANNRGGREFYAIGSDPDAAELYGLAKTKRVLIAFVASGAASGLGGVLFAARYGTINSQVGDGFELQAIGAAVIGGVAIVGGSGTVLGAVFGSFLLLTINRALPVLGIPDFWQRAVVGALIIGAIILDRVLAVRQAKRLQSERSQA
ncbi:MAG TPA: ABC transporter permease [Propionicimonas sp.]|nr:ABC transporter permease [Propionicimonas sp.]HRA05525.1 ABC transporter permease [Propionicimonas sp.]